MDNIAKTQQEIEHEMLELNEQFAAFLNTKGITAKFRLAFNNMSESIKKQHTQDIAEFEAVKAQSAEDNKEFAEFLRAKGIKAKYKLVIDSIRKGAKEAPANTAAQIAKIRAETQAAVARATAFSKPHAVPTAVSASSLEVEFNAYLQSKGLDGRYTVSVTE